MAVSAKATILVVDGTDVGPALAGELGEGFRVGLAVRAEQVADLLKELRPGLVILGQGPALDTDATLLALRGGFLTAEIPVLVLVDAGDTAAERRLLRAGAADVLDRPVRPDVLRARVAHLLEVRLLRATLRDQNSHLDYLVAERTREAARVRDAVIMAMASLAEVGEPGAVSHLRRTQTLFTLLARELRFHPRFAGELSDGAILLMAQAVPLHDIGKVRVPAEIVLKPGRLTDAEFEIMKLHTVYGRDAINAVKEAIGGSNPFLRYAREIAYSHQEKWDGSGYPQGLKGEQIPLSARLMAVADVYDALVSERVYKLAFTHETAIELIRQGRGEHFDPDIVDALLAIEDRFRAVTTGCAFA